jgi:hypothetical protein
MKGRLDINAINMGLAKATKEFVAFCSTMSDEQFFRPHGEKWSAARQVKHLVQSTTISGYAFRFPKWLVSLAGGKANRPSRDYEVLVEKYSVKLQQGGKAPARFIPKPVSPGYGREKLLNEFAASMNSLAKAMTRKRSEQDMDKYVIPHPLLGKITLRELGYFTIHHTYHHLNSIRERANGN